MKATKKLALVCAALAAAAFGFVSCSSDDDSDYDDNATAVALIRQPTSWKATGKVYTTKTENAVAGTTSTVVVETDYSTGNTTTTTTDVDKNGKTTTTVVSVDRSTGKTTTTVDGVSSTSEADLTRKYTSYDCSDVISFAFNGTFTETSTEKYVTGTTVSTTNTSTQKGSFSGYPTLANQTITLLPTSSEDSNDSSFTVDSTTSSISSSSETDMPSTYIGKVSSDKNTLTVTGTYTTNLTIKNNSTASSNTTETRTYVTTYAKQ